MQSRMTVTAYQHQVVRIQQHSRVVYRFGRHVIDVVNDNASTIDATITAALAQAMRLLDVFSTTLPPLW